MKFNFKIQQYQTDAVNAVVNVFSGQSYRKTSHYIRDLGTLEKPAVAQLSFDYENDPYDDIGFKNNALELSSEQLLENVHKIQRENNIKLSPELIKTSAGAALISKWKQAQARPMCISKQCLSLIKNTAGASLLL